MGWVSTWEALKEGEEGLEMVGLGGRGGRVERSIDEDASVPSARSSTFSDNASFDGIPEDPAVLDLDAEEVAAVGSTVEEDLDATDDAETQK